MKAKVYFSKIITGEKVLELIRLLNKELPKPLAIKLHSGERGNQNFIKPEFWKPVIDEMKGTVVECNTAYDGGRNTDIKHLELIKDHGWDRYFDFDLMDINGSEMVLDIQNGQRIKKNYVGGHMKNYKSMLVLSHFKGHPMGGYGGALKQLSIGCASSKGKAYIHSGGRTTSQILCWLSTATQDKFLEGMADAASVVNKMFEGNVAYINVMANMSVDCDCCAVAEDPCMKDIGMLASIDPVAVDQACVDLIYAAKDDPGQKHLLERIESRHGVHTIEAAEALGIGSRKYELIEF